ncbi:hypothetical protein [Streptomyces sp. SID3343]|uniref:hypothetical protein n=1 Tax=Streptomyces sp. SID3343 TaxID=2690260 RepID=UPI00136E0B0C|nr:hypothetical protein [Streptomyces sp. SID3343]MYW03876.1 hypothetical protein [Streptomyces sp. SID3343]
MTAIVTSATVTANARIGSRFRRTATAGYVHAAAWIVGLTVGAGALPEAGDSHAEIAAAYDGHAAQAIGQSVLVHGIAAAAIAAVAVALTGRGMRLAGWTAWLAAALAAGQLALEQVAIAASDPDRVGTLYNLSLRVDGVKMLAFAVVAVATTAVLAKPWQRWTAYATAATITVSGLGYLFANTALGGAAILSLPLLLVSVALLGRRA